MKFAALFLVLILAAPLSVAQDAPVKQDPPVTKDTPVEPAADQKIVVADDLVSALDAADNFTILVKALRDTGLDKALSGTETFTLFAPTDEAFQKLPAGTLDGLTADELVGILRYHVLAGTVTSADAAALTSAPTVEGDELAIATTDEGLTVGEAHVTEADIEVSNGVIHVIDTVLLPSPAEAALEGQAAGGQASETMDVPTTDDSKADEDNDQKDDQDEEGDDQDNSEASPETTDDQR